MVRLKKLNGHDVDTREYAILYINGEFIKGNTHSGCIMKYFDNNDIEYTPYGLYYRKQVEEKIDETESIVDYAFLHYVDGEMTCVEENTGIYIDTNSLHGISLGELVSKIQAQYPGLSIYDDNKILSENIFKIEYEKLAKVKKKSCRDYVFVELPLYPQDYFEMRNPSRLKKIKEMHDKNEYLSFEEITKPTMTAGLAMDKVNSMPGDTVTVYHGCSAAFIDSILANGLTENIDNSYQSHGVNYGLGIWVTLNYDGAKNYAVHSARGWTRDNSESQDEEITQYFNYGAIIEMELNKTDLNDEGSASNNNLKSNDIITPDKIRQIYIFDINTGETWNWF